MTVPAKPSTSDALLGFLPPMSIGRISIDGRRKVTATTAHQSDFHIILHTFKKLKYFVPLANISIKYHLVIALHTLRT